MERKTYYEDSDFRVYLEKIDEELFVHVAINKFDKSILSRVKEIWAEVALDAYFEGYEDLFAYTKDNRIINMIGGAELVAHHKEYEVWKWELN